MVAYSFKARFADLVESHVKRQTIRAVGKRRHARPGEALQLYTGMRTKQCRKLLPDQVCLGVDNIVITEGAELFVGESLLTYPTLLARQDGFASFRDFIEFFRTTHGLPFAGVLIRW